jgi:23S rRNA-/tRNA-specific pseudouridylate synthase
MKCSSTATSAPCKCFTVLEPAPARSFGTGVEIVHRDEDLLVLFKPAGLPTTSSDGLGCLAALARELDPTAPHLHASSRLDVEVTGLVTFARNRAANERLLAARKAGTYRRLYLALATRAPEPPEGEWRWEIARDPRNQNRRLALPEDSGRGAVAHTHYRLLDAAPAAAGLLLRPETGRTHQLRVHAAAAGLPLLGDKQYGGPVQLVQSDGRVLRASRVMLHCARISLPGDRSFDAPAPSDMCELFAKLGGAPESLRACS